jgi:tetratricopeptide (TPR) repeat protein
MKKLILLVITLVYGLTSSACTLRVDTAVKQTPVVLTTLDSLKQQLQLATNDTLKSAIYTQIAAEYLKYDNLDIRTKRFYQAQALNYSYLALHLYSELADTAGLCTTFNSLSKVYRSQKKYPQAKWFILQSNSLSRLKNDVPNVMASLIVLANIKMEIKDYSLAMRDLNEALKLSVDNRQAKVESRVQESYALLYTHLKNYTKADIASKRHDYIEDSLLKGQEVVIAKTQDTLQVKKKVLTASRKLSKTSYSKKIASL